MVVAEIHRREAVLISQLQEQTRVTFERLLEELASPGFADIGRMFDANGRLLSISAIPETTRRAIRRIDFYEGRGKHRLTRRLRVQLFDKIAALRAIAMLCGFYPRREKGDEKTAVLKWADE